MSCLGFVFCFVNPPQITMIVKLFRGLACFCFFLTTSAFSHCQKHGFYTFGVEVEVLEKCVCVYVCVAVGGGL